MKAYVLYYLSPSPVEFSCSASRTQAIEYLDSQLDPLAAKEFKVANKNRSWVVTSSYPFSAVFSEQIQSIEFNWDDLSEFEPQSNALWKYSIGYLPALLKASNDLELTDFLLNTLWEFTKSNAWQDKAKFMTSLDHALAIRIRTICALAAYYTLQQKQLPSSALLLLANDVLNLLSEDNDFFPINNHGAMTAIALIHVAALFPTLDVVTERVNQTSVSSVAWSKLNYILQHIFDKYGVASENSPEYHRFWITLLNPMDDLLRLFPSSNTCEYAQTEMKISKILTESQKSLGYFLDNCQRLLAIGDSHPRKVLETDSQTGILISEEMGFGVYKSSNTTFTLNSGYTNYTHKHCDDSSITLSYGHQNLILDSGYYGHDWTDNKVIYTKSQSAHSGVFFTGLDNLHPGNLYFPGRERISSCLINLDETDNKFHVKSHIVIDDSAEITREVLMISPNEFDIVDYASGAISEGGTVVRRFILPLGAQISVQSNKIAIDYGSSILKMYFSNQLDIDEVNVTCGRKHPFLSGWISPERYTLEPALCLEIPLTLNIASTMHFLIHDS